MQITFPHNVIQHDLQHMNVVNTNISCDVFIINLLLKHNFGSLTNRT